MNGFWSHAKTVLIHKWYVFKFGRKIRGIPLLNLLIHDWTKFSNTERDAYIRRYFSGGCSTLDWQYAWLHHIHHNPHHWEHWVLKGKALPMPERFVREMVADWMAVGQVYQNTANIQPWLDQNAAKMILHEQTAETLKRVLQEQNLKWSL